MCNIKKIKFYKDVIFSRCEKFLFFDFKNEFLDDLYNNKEIFNIYWNIYKKKDKLMLDSSLLKSNIFVIYSGNFGREYSKTCIFKTQYKKNDKSALFEILEGSGYFILENNDNIKNIKIIKVKKNSYVYVPQGYYFSIINNGKSNLVIYSLLGKNTKFVKGCLKNQNGSALFLINNNFIKNKNINSNYNLHKYENDYLDDKFFDKNKGIYKQFLECPDKFNFLK